MNTRRALLAGGGAWALAAATPLRAAASPAASGFEVARHDLDWRDPQRDRRVPLRLYWPAGALNGALPLVLVSHGFGGDRNDMAWAGQRLAAQGVACLHVQHVGSDRRVWLSGPPVWVLRELRGEMARERLDRVLDLRFALDRLLAGEWGRMVDRRRIAAVGHSLGAQTVLLLGGARLAGQAPLRDARIGAVAALGLASFAGEDTARVLRSVEVPSLHVTTEEDRTVLPGYAANPDERVAWFRTMGGPAKAMAVFGKGAHAIFNDAGPDDPVGAATAELVHGFLRQLWQPGAPPLAGWHERHRPLVSRFETLGALHADTRPPARPT